MTYTDQQPPPASYVEEPPPEDWTPPTNRPPQDPLAEQYVIGAVLNDPTQYDECARIITAGDFYRPNHEALWRTFAHLHAAEQPLAAVAVLAHLVDTGQVNKVGGAPYLHECITLATSPAEAPHFARRIDGLARRRTAITKLESGLDRLRNPGPDHDVDDILNTTATHFTEARDSLANPTQHTTWTPVDLEPVLAGEHLDPPPTMLRRTDGIPLFYEGAVHTVSGESESGKTWVCLLAAMQLTQERRRVVFLDFEDRADRVIGRLMALGAMPQEIRDHFAYVRPDRPLDDDGRAQLAPHLTGTALVILDGVTEAMTTHGFDLNSNADSALFQALLPRWIADHGPAVAMIDHVVKDKEKQDRFALGAQHKLAGIDGAAYIVKTLQPFGRGKRGLARIEIAKDRPGHVREHSFGRTIAEFTLDATASDVILTAHLMPPGEQSGRHGDTFEPTIFMEKISRAVQLTPGLSKKAIEDLISGKAATKRLALELLVARGYIGAKAGQRGAIQHFHVKPYYADGGPEEQTETEPEAPLDQEAS